MQLHFVRQGSSTLAKLHSLLSFSLSLFLSFYLFLSKQLSRRIAEYRIVMVVVVFGNEKDDQVFGFHPPCLGFYSLRLLLLSNDLSTFCDAIPRFPGVLEVND